MSTDFDEDAFGVDDFGSDEELQQELEEGTEFQRKKIFLPSGVTLLDLFCTGTTQGAYAAGDYVILVGDSSAGKSWLSLSALAEAVRHPFFKSHRIIFDDVENGLGMNIEKYFGRGLVDRIEYPGGIDEETELGICSDTVEKFYAYLDDAFKIGDPFIYVLDSMTALDTKEAEETFQANKHKEGKLKATMGDTAKARYNSQNIRRYAARLRKHNSILIVTCQTRQKFGVMFGDDRTYSGGKALKFYSHSELWMSSTPVYQEVKFDASKIDKPVDEETEETPKKKRGLAHKGKPVKEKKESKKKRVIGSIATVKIKKNRNAGFFDSVRFPIFNAYGVDDIQANIDFLLETKAWKKTLGKVTGTLTEKFTLPEKEVSRYVEDNELEDVLKMLVAKVWKEYVKTGHETRKKKYQ